MRIDVRGGKKSSTEWKLLADFGEISLLAVQPITGRTHQIRVHLASAGMPLAIDPLYGSNNPIMLSDFKNKYTRAKFSEEKPLMDRLTLHCYQLEFKGQTHRSAPTGTQQLQSAGSADESDTQKLRLLPPLKTRGRNDAKTHPCHCEERSDEAISSFCFTAPLDKKFAATIKMLTKHNSNGPAAFLNETDFEKIITAQKI